MAKKATTQKTNANIGFEKQLWDAACVLWGHIPAAEYRKVIIGLIFLRYISSAFDKRYEELVKDAHTNLFVQTYFKAYQLGMNVSKYQAPIYDAIDHYRETFHRDPETVQDVMDAAVDNGFREEYKQAKQFEHAFNCEFMRETKDADFNAPAYPSELLGDEVTNKSLDEFGGLEV